MHEQALRTRALELGERWVDHTGWQYAHDLTDFREELQHYFGKVDGYTPALVPVLFERAKTRAETLAA